MDGPLCYVLVTVRVIMPHLSTTWMQPVATDRVVWSVGLSVRIMTPAKMAELIEMPSGMWTRVGPRNHVLNGVLIGAIWWIRLNHPVWHWQRCQITNYFIHLLNLSSARTYPHAGQLHQRHNMLYEHISQVCKGNMICSATLCVAGTQRVRLQNSTRSTTTTVLRPFFQDHLCEPENFWTLWCKERLTEADTQTIRLGATPSGLTSAHLHHPPFFTGRMPFLPPNQQYQSTEGNEFY